MFQGSHYGKGVNRLPIKYKMDVLSALKCAGYSSYRIRNDKLLGEATLQKIRRGELVSWENISTICKLLNCQPGDIVEYQPDHFSESMQKGGAHYGN